MEQSTATLFNLEEIKKPNPEKEARQKIDELAYIFTDPLVTYPGPWADTLPGWVREQVTLDRLASMMRGEVGMATNTEVLAYLYPASFEAPMQRGWAQIYLYVATKSMELAGKTVPDDIRVDKLTSDEERELKHLKHRLYEKRIKNRIKMRRK